VGQLYQDIGFDVDGCAWGQGVQVGAPVSQRKNCDGDRLAVKVGDGEADAFDGDGAFVDHPGADVLGDMDFEGPVGAVLVESRTGWIDYRIEGAQDPAAIYVALDDVAAEGTAGGGGQFEVDFCAGGQRAEGGFVEGFLRKVGVEVRVIDIERGEADAGDAERIAFAEAVGEAGGFNGDAADAAGFFEADEGAGLLDDAGEHGYIL